MFYKQLKVRRGAKELSLVHLAFAKDLLIFFRKRDVRSMALIKQYLEEFCDASGLRANPYKSYCYLADVNDDRKMEILNELGFAEGSLPIKYIGCPLHSKRILISDYDPLLSKI